MWFKKTMDIYEYAKIIRSMNEHEDKLKDQRTKLLMSAQAILFAATSFIWDKNLFVVLVISVLGYFFCDAIKPSLENGRNAGENLQKEWRDRKSNEKTYNGPPVFALGDEYNETCSKHDWETIITWLKIAWIAVLVIALIQLLVVALIKIVLPLLGIDIPYILYIL